MIANSVGFGVGEIYFVSSYLFATFNGFQHGAIGMPATAGIIYFALPGLLLQMPEHIYQIPGMNMISYLLAFVDKYGVMLFGDSAFHQVR